MAEERLFENISYDEAVRIMQNMGRIPENPKIDGHGMVVRCLFHDDKNPSAKISPNPATGDLLYMCWSCHIEKRDPQYMLKVKRELGIFRETYTTEEGRDTFDWAKQAKGENVHDLGEKRREKRDIPKSWRGIGLRDYTPGSQPQPSHGFVMPYEWAIFYPASVNEIHGPSESMKTWVALHCIVEVIKRGEHAAFIDFEDGPGPIADRLRAMGLDDDELDRVFYAYVTEPMPISQAEDIIDEVFEMDPSIVIVNGVIEALAVQGIDTNDNRGYTAWVRLYTRPFADRGACVILIDHTSIKEGASPSALGATAKMNIVQGASYLIEVGQEIAPAKRMTTTGWTALKLWKDRPGQVRQHGFKRRDVVAELHMVAQPNGSVQCTLEAASATMEDMLKDQAQHDSTEALERQIWTAIANAKARGGIAFSHVVDIGNKPHHLGKNGTTRLLESWLNAGHIVETRGEKNARLLNTVSDEYPGRFRASSMAD